jgi:hypothetical protein
MKGKATAHKLWNLISPIRSVLGLLLLLCLQLPWRIIRASNPYSIWTDEIYSLLIASRPLEYLIRITSVDAHPPGYYFLLKIWLDFTGIFGMTPNVLLARFPSIIAWVVLVIAAWFGGRYLIGKRGGTFFAWLLAWNAQMAYIARDIRNYAIATTALFICFLIILIADRLDREGKHSLFKGTLLWFIYTLSAITALWMHLLTAIIMLLIGLTWVLLCLYRKPIMTNYLVGGFIANFIAAACFIPWLIQLSHQLEYLGSVKVDWMTEPTFTNWQSVFTFWYPGGRQYMSSMDLWLSLDRFFHILVPFTLLPLAIGLLSGFCRNRRADDRRLSIYAGLGTILPLLFVSICWYLSFLEIAKVFHAPRYPVLTAPLWFFAFACWTELALQRFQLRQWWGWLILTPVFLASLYGESIMKQTESSGFSQLPWLDNKNLPPKGTPAYFSPSLTQPYLTSTFSHFDLHPLTDLSKLETLPEDLVIIKGTEWLPLQSPADRLVSALLYFSTPAQQVEWIKIPDQQWPVYSIYLLHKPDSKFIQRIIQPCGKYSNPLYSKAITVALPEAQLYIDGFSHLEIPTQGEPFCWGSQEKCHLRFDQPISPGEYLLKINLFRHPYPEEKIKMTFSFLGEDTSYTKTVDPGATILSIPVSLKKRSFTPTLITEHPIWTPKEHLENNQDTRELTFLFSGAWLEPVESE